MKKFTSRTRLFKVRHCKEFAAFKKYVLAPRQFSAVMQVYSIRNLGAFYPINADNTAEALNAMRRKAADGSLTYTPFERKDTGVYSFLIGQNAPFVLIMPGGGYADVCSLIEGYPVAVRLNELGYNAFIVNYSVGKIRPAYPAEDVAAALNYVLSNREKLNVGAEYAVCGFSAGGHLAACWGTEALGYPKYGFPKPKAVFLAYPVITMGEFTHIGSRSKLLGKDADPALRDRYSVELQVTDSYPPVFVWQCKNDKTVPFENSLMMAEALKKHGVRYEFMPVEGSAHGWGYAKGTAAEGWLEKAVAFLQSLPD